MKKKSSIPKIIGIILAVLILGGGAGYFGYQYYQSHLTTVVVHTIGEKELTIDVGTNYTDKGAAAAATNEAEGARKIAVTASGTVDTETVGTYEITYVAIYDGTQYTDKRIVHVVDREAPVLTAEYKTTQNRTWMDGPARYQYEAEDNYDGDITNLVQVKEADGYYTFTVSDKAGNEATAKLKKLPIIEEPVIQFPDNSQQITVYTDEDLFMPEPTAFDGMDNDLSGYVLEEGEVDTSVPGSYKIRYFIQNKAGESVEAFRTVIVRQRLNTNSPADYSRVIYLTFNGGPGPNTEEILGIMRRYNVHATFFVSGWKEAYKWLIGEIRDDGHTIGAYCYTDNMYELYKSIDAYKEDFGKIQGLIQAQTGSMTPYMRFPGGSEKGIGEGATEFVMTILRSDFKNSGYKYIDWTIDPGDTFYQADQVYSFVTESIQPNSPNIVAMNDNSESAVDALENIILWGLRNGYTFMPIT